MTQQDCSLFVRINGKEKESLLGDVTRVGRGPECEVRVSHSTCSRMHFTVRREADGWSIEHGHPETQNIHGKWATIKTYVNGAQVKATSPLSLGDVITFRPEAADDQDVVIEIGPSRDPVPAEAGKPWWKIW